MNNSLLEKTQAWFCAASIKNVCAKFKVDPLSILTEKKHRQIKFLRLEKVRIWAFGLLVH